MEIPKLAGQTFDGSDLTIDPADGKPKVIVFLAHWCPHCQAEVPLIKEYIDSGNAPSDVEFYSVATQTDAGKANYPPSGWLAREGWQPPVLLDDSSGERRTVVRRTGLAVHGVRRSGRQGRAAWFRRGAHGPVRGSRATAVGQWRRRHDVHLDPGRLTASAPKRTIRDQGDPRRQARRQTLPVTRRSRRSRRA